MSVKRAVFFLFLFLNARLVSASAFDALPDEMLSEFILANPSLDAIIALERTCKRFKKVVNSEKVVIGSEHGVQTKGRGTSYWWKLIKHDPEALIACQPASWRNEAVEAAANEKEPTYLKALSSLIANRLHEFAITKEAEGQMQSREAWLRHGYTILFTGWAFNYAVLNHIKNDAWNISWRGAAGSAGWVMADGFAWGRAVEAMRDAMCAVFEHVNRCAMKGAAYVIMGEGLSNHVSDAASEVGLKKKSGVHSLARLVYRVTERSVGIYYLKNACNILETFYASAFGRMNVARSSEVLSSPAQWVNFKKAHFDKLSQSESHFIAPFVAELDRIVEIIATMEE